MSRRKKTTNITSTTLFQAACAAGVNVISCEQALYAARQRLAAVMEPLPPEEKKELTIAITLLIATTTTNPA